MIKIIDEIFTKNESKCLEFFLSRPGKSYTVREISKNLKISVPRTYGIVNKLYVLSFLDKIADKHIKFTISNPEDAFKKYFSKEYDKIKNMESNLYDYILPNCAFKKADTVLISSNEEVYKTAYQMMLNTNAIKIFAKTPVLLLPQERSDFWREKAFQIYRRKIEMGADFYYLIDLKRVQKLISQKNIRDVRAAFKWLKQYPNFHIKDIGGKDMASMVITEKEALISIHHNSLGNRISSGVIFTTKEILDFLSSNYDKMFMKAKEINKII